MLLSSFPAPLLLAYRIAPAAQCRASLTDSPHPDVHKDSMHGLGIFLALRARPTPHFLRVTRLAVFDSIASSVTSTAIWQGNK